jgi:hypothetical protein
MRILLGTVIIILCGFSVSLSEACSRHGTNAGNGLWLPTNSSGGMVHGLLSLDTSLVAPTAPTTCTAGVGLGSLATVSIIGLILMNRRWCVV